MTFSNYKDFSGGEIVSVSNKEITIKNYFNLPETFPWEISLVPKIGLPFESGILNEVLSISGNVLTVKNSVVIDSLKEYYFTNAVSSKYFNNQGVDIKTRLYLVDNDYFYLGLSKLENQTATDSTFKVSRSEVNEDITEWTDKKYVDGETFTNNFTDVTNKVYS